MVLSKHDIAPSNVVLLSTVVNVPEPCIGLRALLFNFDFELNFEAAVLPKLLALALDDAISSA
jgi:hypothetical protein